MRPASYPSPTALRAGIISPATRSRGAVAASASPAALAASARRPWRMAFASGVPPSSGVLALVENGSLSYGHARAILPLAEKLGEKELLAVAEKIAEEDLSVRQTEALVKKMLTDATVKDPDTKDPVKSQYLKVLERSVSESAGRKAAIKAEKDGSGKLVLSFASTEDLETLLTALCGKHFLEELSETL